MLDKFIDHCKRERILYRLLNKDAWQKNPSETQPIFPLVVCILQNQKQSTTKSEIQVLRQKKHPLDIGYNNRN